MEKMPQKPLGEQMDLLRRLFLDNWREHWKGYLVALVFMAIVAAMTGLSAWIMRDVINEIFVEKNADMVPVIAGVVAAIFITKGIAGYVQAVVLSRTGNAIVAGIQMRLFDHVQRQRIDFFDDQTLGQLNMRFSQGARAAARRSTRWSPAWGATSSP